MHTVRDKKKKSAVAHSGLFVSPIPHGPHRNPPAPNIRIPFTRKGTLATTPKGGERPGWQSIRGGGGARE